MSDQSIAFVKDIFVQTVQPNLSYVIALILGLVTLLFYYLHKSKTSGTGVLLLGISGSGKTHLFSKLVCKESKNTLISLKENEADYSVVGTDGKVSKRVDLVDVPGSSSIRDHIFNQFKSKAKGIVFVVDSAVVQKNLKDVASFLYQVLTDKVINEVGPKVLVACSKQDLLTSKSKRVIEGLLTDELNTVRKTQVATLDSLSGDEASKRVFLGKKNKDFEFSDLKKLNVKFCECSVEENEDGLDVVKQWIDAL